MQSLYTMSDFILFHLSFNFAYNIFLHRKFIYLYNQMYEFCSTQASEFCLQRSFLFKVIFFFFLLSLYYVYGFFYIFWHLNN